MTLYRYFKFLFANSPEIIESEIVDVALLAPALLILSNYFSAIFAFIFRISFNDEEIAAFTAINIRW